MYGIVPDKKVRRKGKAADSGEWRNLGDSGILLDGSTKQ